jgi:hypothetical protein
MYCRAVAFGGFVYCFLSAFQSFGQQAAASDSAFYSGSVRQLYHIYFDQIGQSAELFNGAEYIRNGQKANGFPFFESNDQLPGDVSCQGILYHDLRLQYDLVLDELITSNYTHDALIRLPKEKVDSFSIAGHPFVRLDAAKTNGAFADNGYYEQLTANDMPVFAKRVKKLVVPNGYEDSKYVQYNTFYLKLNNGFYVVEGKNSLLDLLKDKKDLLKKFIRTNKLNFKKRPEEAIVRTTSYYARLKS